MPKSKPRAKAAAKKKKQLNNHAAPKTMDDLRELYSQLPPKQQSRLEDIIVLTKIMDQRGNGWTLMGSQDDPMDTHPPAWEHRKTVTHPTTGEKQVVRSKILTTWDEYIFLIPPPETGDEPDGALAYETAEQVADDIEAIEALVPWISLDEIYRIKAPNSVQFESPRPGDELL